MCCNDKVLEYRVDFHTIHTVPELLADTQLFLLNWGTHKHHKSSSIEYLKISLADLLPKHIGFIYK